MAYLSSRNISNELERLIGNKKGSININRLSNELGFSYYMIYKELYNLSKKNVIKIDRNKKGVRFFK